MQYIDFTVQHQTITRTDKYEVVGKSQNYLYARFQFCEEWADIIPTAVFSLNNGKHYSALIEEGVCLVPWEVLEGAEFWVGVFGGERMTTSTVRVPVKPSVKLNAGPGLNPSPTAYETLVANAAASANTAAEASESAEASAEAAAESEKAALTAAERAEKVMDSVVLNEAKMAEYEGKASASAAAAKVSEDNAAASETAAIDAANRAQAEANRATIPAVSGVYNVVLADSVTNERYALIVENGRLSLLGVSNSLDSAEVSLIDNSTGTAYELAVESGRLHLKEV